MIAIDTQVLIWGVKPNPDDRPDMIEKARAFIVEASKTGERIMIPSLVVAEFLVNYPDDSRDSVMAMLAKHFYLAPHDAKAAKWSARMFKEQATWKEIRTKANSTRQWIKVDLGILATAAAHGATSFYAEDGPLFTAAEGFADILPMTVHRLPPAPEKED